MTAPNILMADANGRFHFPSTTAQGTEESVSFLEADAQKRKRGIFPRPTLMVRFTSNFGRWRQQCREHEESGKQTFKSSPFPGYQ